MHEIFLKHGADFYSIATKVRLKHSLDFFRSLNTVLCLEPQRDWSLTPGPGDMRSEAITLAMQNLRDTVKEQQTLNQLVRDPDTMRLLNAGLRDYGYFTDRFLGPPRAFSPESPWRWPQMSQW